VRRSRFDTPSGVWLVLALLLSACGVDDEVVVGNEGASVSVLGKAIDDIGGSGLAEVSKVLEVDCLAERGLSADEIDSSLDRAVAATQVSATDFGVASSIRADIDQMIAYLDDMAGGGVPRDELWGTPD